ncbi:class I SAM-dependent methyltransferase [candidate division KSB1 bacterium]|nr:class I SAM-dependent methyltransferase [candidate division KSB1 bacterium]
MAPTVERPGVRKGYDLWAQSYDETSNPLVALDSRYTLSLLQPRQDERILDAGCGTGRYLSRLRKYRTIGLDFSIEMLKSARNSLHRAALIQADLVQPLPIRANVFDAILCSLVGEHLTDPGTTFYEFYRVLKNKGRLLFSVIHPEMVTAGIEAKFARDEKEHRLGAELHSINDYVDAVTKAGFRQVRYHEYCGDRQLVEKVPDAGKYVGRKFLLIIEALRDDEYDRNQELNKS